MEETIDTKVTVVVTSPSGRRKYKTQKVNRGLLARFTFEDWKQKNKGSYIDIIQDKFTEDEKNKFPKALNVELKIAEIIAKECEVYIEGVQQDVYHLIKKYWNQLPH
jgi:hypothetical protein